MTTKKNPPTVGWLIERVNKNNGNLMGVAYDIRTHKWVGCIYATRFKSKETAIAFQNEFGLAEVSRPVEHMFD